MDGVTALVAELLYLLRGMLAIPPAACDWAWSVTALGVGVGLVPAVGAVVVSLLRRRIGSRYGVGGGAVLIGTGLLTAGLLPLLAFTGTGRLFAGVAAGTGVAGLDVDAAGLSGAACVIGDQATYLGVGTVAQTLAPERAVQYVLLVALVLLPLVTAGFVAVQARLSLRRGPAWPAKFFWLPVLALAVLTATVPAASAAHLWLGMSLGAFVGIFVLLIAGVPSWATVRRSLAAPAPSPVPAPRPQPAARPAPRPPSPRPTRQPSSPQQSPAEGTFADRLAERFAARPPESPVLPLASASLDRGARPPVTAVARKSLPTPTLVAPLSGLTPGEPRFQLLRRLGAGGFGKVWLAHDARLGHTVALKAAHAPDAETEQRIQREARALGAVRHPHCVRIYDLVPADSDPGLSELEGMVIVMEYIDGSSLGELVRGHGTLDDVAAARVWASVAGALDAAHARGVMHRDVKPGNVVVDASGLAHLIDFGIARRTGDATMTLAGFVLGTPDFLAPEVAGGQRATPASDSWQLAATISYALTGHPPRGGHPDAVSGLRAAASGAPLSHLPPRSAHLALLRAALDNDPARRPPLRAAHRALEDWLRRTGVRPDGPVAAGTRRP